MNEWMNGGENRRTQHTTHPPSWRYYVVFRQHYVRACIFGVSNLKVWTFRSCRAAAYTAMRGKDRAMHLPALLLFGAVSPAPSAGASILIVVSYRYRIIVYRYRYRIAGIISVRCYRIVIERYNNRNFRYDIQHLLIVQASTPLWGVIYNTWYNKCQAIQL